MYIKTTYIGTLPDGTRGMWVGFLPENVTVTEERDVLYAEEGKTLILKATEENVGTAVWLKDTVQDDYEELDYVEPEEPDKVSDVEEEE